MFDTMAQQLFNLARRPAIAEVLGPGRANATVSEQAGYSTMIFMIGWALGGLVFGGLGDRIGRAKTMVTTILLYSVFIGLSYFSRSVWDFNVFRLLCSLGASSDSSFARVPQIEDRIESRHRAVPLSSPTSIHVH